MEGRTLRSCIQSFTVLHYFNTICPWPKNGTFGVPGRPRPGRGTMSPGKYGTVGNPTVHAHDFLLFLPNSNVVCFNRLSGGPLDINDHETSITPNLYSPGAEVLLWARPKQTVPYQPVDNQRINFPAVFCALLLLASGDIKLNSGPNMSSLLSLIHI